MSFLGIQIKDIQMGSSIIDFSQCFFMSIGNFFCEKEHIASRGKFIVNAQTNGFSIRHSIVFFPKIEDAFNSPLKASKHLFNHN